jgi:phage terminase large subunit
MPVTTVQRSGSADAPLPFFRKPAGLKGADLRRPAAPGENRKRDRRSRETIEAERARKEAARLATLPSPDQIPDVQEQIDPNVFWATIREAYRDDPVAFVVDVLGAQPQPWQLELLEQVGSGEKRLSVVSGHNVGKTAAASWTVIHHAITQYPQKTIVSSPAASQLKLALIPELKKWFYRLPEPLLGLFEIKSESIVLRQAPHASFIEARTASRDSPESMQGIHCEDGSVLLVVDEASGVPDSVFQAAEGSMAGPNAHMLLISNPTRLSGFFFQTQHDWADHAAKPIATAWRTLHISSLDARCTLSNDNFVQGVADKYGVESNEYRLRVLGLFPDSESNVLIAPELIDSALVRDIAVNPSDPLIYGVDVGRQGADRTVLVKRRGNVVIDVQSWSKRDTAESAALVWQQALLDSPDEICIDSIGFGAGTADSLRALGCKSVRDVNVAEVASTNPVCWKLRDDLWWSVREWLATRAVRLFANDDLIEDLRMPTYSYTTGSQKVVILAKDLMRKVIGRSPDYGDALALTFAGTGALLAGRTSMFSNWKTSLRRNLAGVV